MTTPPAIVELGTEDLTASGQAYCPNPKADMKLWDTHPRVYLRITDTGEVQCPYCSTVYRLKEPNTAAPTNAV